MWQEFFYSHQLVKPLLTTEKNKNNQDEFVILNETSMTFERVKGAVELKERVKTLLDKDTNKVKIFILTATAEKEIKITYEGENFVMS